MLTYKSYEKITIPLKQRKQRETLLPIRSPQSITEIRDLTMVRVWYQPPPGGGARTNLNRGAYYSENAMTPVFLKKLQRMQPVRVIVPAVAFIAALCYIPLSK
jgi:hypothetical protein